MCLERKDIRAKLDAGMHAKLKAICELDGIDMGDWIEQVIVPVIEKRAHDAIELASPAPAPGIFRERKARPGKIREWPGVTAVHPLLSADPLERLSADDLAAQREEMFRAAALHVQALASERETALVQARRGECLNCGALCRTAAVYCDVDCRADHEARRLRGVRTSGRSPGRPPAR